MTDMISSLRLLLLLLPTALLPACSPSQKIEELSSEFRQYYANMNDYGTLPQRSLSWEEALAKLEKDNLEYCEALRQRKNSQFHLGSSLRSLIPLLDTGYYYNAPLQWGKGYPAQSNFNINIFFNLPQLVQLPIDHYTDSLALIKADTDCRIKKRELESRLYQAFREYALLRREWELVERLPAQNSAERQLAREGHEQKMRENWSKLCILINDHSARWQPDAAGLPRITLGTYRRRSQAPDKLFLANLALQAEVARLSRLGVGMRFLPAIQVSFLSPSLFSSTGGNKGFMQNADDVRINLNSYISLDTKLENFQNYKDAKEGEKLVLKSLHQSMRLHREKIQAVLKSWERYQQWRRSMEDYIAFRNQQGFSGFEEAALRHKESMELEKALIDQERANLERECAAMQEYGWRGESSGE